MSNIEDLSTSLDNILRKFETERELTCAETVGVLENLKLERQLNSMLPLCGHLLREALEEPVEAVSGPPTGPIITKFEGEDSMET